MYFIMTLKSKRVYLVDILINKYLPYIQHIFIFTQFDFKIPRLFVNYSILCPASCRYCFSVMSCLLKGNNTKGKKNIRIPWVICYWYFLEDIIEKWGHIKLIISMVKKMNNFCTSVNKCGTYLSNIEDKMS